MTSTIQNVSTNDLAADAAAADAAMKAKHRAMWASGDYPAVARDIVEPLGDILVAAAGVEAGQWGIDIAAGSGNATLAAARRGAKIIAHRPGPGPAGRRARPGGVGGPGGLLEAKPMPSTCPTPTANSTSRSRRSGSCSPRTTRQSADELVRVVGSGGTIGVLSWTPEGFIGQLFATMKPYVAPPPPGVSARAAVGQRRPRHPAARRPGARHPCAPRALSRSTHFNDPGGFP